MAAVGVVYFVGFVLSIFVYRARAGVGIARRLQIFGSQGFGLAWLALQVVKAIGWPVVLGVWLARGRPEPMYVFNDKARRLEAQRQQGAAMSRSFERN